ncbi:hypothetical protein [Pelagibacterium luteolum]|uniref:hypothetical protein n=1 Tax=Pelagibacterium luteolum TaxID=440168 RepID=UPI00115FADC2|nr:hypothetical protein [Pelagibacterium luteolum]
MTQIDRWARAQHRHAGRFARTTTSTEIGTTLEALILGDAHSPPAQNTPAAWLECSEVAACYCGRRSSSIGA